MSDYNRSFNGEAKIKLTQLINEGMQVLQEVEDLNTGLNETIKAIAEELEIKPATLKKAVKIGNRRVHQHYQKYLVRLDTRSVRVRWKAWMSGSSL